MVFLRISYPPHYLAIWFIVYYYPFRTPFQIDSARSVRLANSRRCVAAQAACQCTPKASTAHSCVWRRPGRCFGVRPRRCTAWETPHLHRTATAPLGPGRPPANAPPCDCAAGVAIAQPQTPRTKSAPLKTLIYRHGHIKAPGVLLHHPDTRRSSWLDLASGRDKRFCHGDGGLAFSTPSCLEVLD